MSKFIITTCLLLFWAFYEMSGGADFEPLERKVVAKAPVTDLPEPPVVVAQAPRPAPIAALVAEVTTASYTPELVIIPAPEPVVEDVTLASAETTVVEDPLIIHQVAGEWVNMRDGPSTSFSVLDTLPRGTKAEILEVNGDGWAQIRLIDSGKTGWMAERLLSEG
ncbi:SH3 domain-containing protein [Yoonia sp. R2-816]|uniref:SH3 domain-containing protein n=1 Tax=Yoonia sp. R2-816 TaxID=3342638 RepID=UPI0037298748